MEARETLTSINDAACPPLALYVYEKTTLNEICMRQVVRYKTCVCVCVCVYHTRINVSIYVYRVF